MKTEQLIPFLISRESTVVEALQKLDANARGILFVINDDRKLLGTLTDGDIRRWLIKTGELQGQVKQIMNPNPKVIYRKEKNTANEFMVKHAITALPVVNAKGVISDIIFRSDDKEEEQEQRVELADVPVVIMAGGKGTRLYPFTKILPKPLIPIGDVPIMERILDRFCDFGARNFYATVNYRKNMIKSYFSENATDYSICYVEEDKPLGTAGSLGLIKEQFDRPFIVTNCDILIHADYADVYRYHMEAENELTIVTALKNIHSRKFFRNH